MAILKCKMCGGTIEFVQGTTVGECQHCGTKQTFPNTSNEGITNLYNRANNLRLKCDFDKAMAVYEKIVEQDDSQAEAHWGIVLCKYGIEYVDDPSSHTKIPTCHRTLYNPVIKDTDYQAAIDFADNLQQSLYEKEARAIDKIQKSIIAIVQKEEPFDVFICYKETDENGKRTKDSVLANDIYHQLTQEDYKVFYAAITLEDKLGQEYEPHIFAALNTAKVMLVVGTDPEYFNSVWVKNEWSRFMSLMNTDRSKLLIPCYRDMDPYDLPEEFKHLQAQDMGKIGFVNDIIRGIKKVINKEKKQEKNESEKTVRTATASVKPLLKRIELFLEDSEFDKADEFCEKVLNIDPENAQVYFYKLLIEYTCNTKEDFYDYVTELSKKNVLTKGCYTKEEIIAGGLPIFDSKNYKKLVRFAKTEEDTSLIDNIDKAIDINADEINDDDIDEVWVDDLEFTDYICPNCYETGSYPNALCRAGSILHCPFCDKDFIVNKTKLSKKTSKDSVKKSDKKQGTYNFYPKSDVNSPLFEDAIIAPQSIYGAKVNQEKIRYTPYLIEGKVVATFKDIYEAAAFFDVQPKEDEEDTEFFSFIIENEFGQMWICDFATVDVNYIIEQKMSTTRDYSSLSERLINEFGGYDESEYPRKGDDIVALGLYMGYNKWYNLPVCYYGINKLYYDWCIE
ncbi:MAG: toll/interleukin-1 receptor domain-containing protein [Lachnospiraceae bacterium]|nr:toll/interleukin-1 receptor domain-containing protein [Lachnospiraceae bacterium]